MPIEIEQMEVYKSPSTIPQISCLVKAFDDKGNLLVHKSVIVPASELDALIAEKDTAEAYQDKLVSAVGLKDADLSDENIAKLVAEKEAQELAWKEAQVILDKVNAKLGAVIAVEEVIAKG